MEKILCVYVTRQVDSNLMMASTVFRGLNEAGYVADMVFVGSTDAIAEFKCRYESYFRRVYYRSICKPLKNNMLYRISPLLYSYVRHFILDAVCLPGVKWLMELKANKYDKILSFIPPVISGRYALKIKECFMAEVPLVQFWTDPLSLGRCNDIDEIPKSRCIHKLLEHRLLCAWGGDFQGRVLVSASLCYGGETASESCA